MGGGAVGRIVPVRTEIVRPRGFVITTTRDARGRFVQPPHLHMNTLTNFGLSTMAGLLIEQFTASSYGGGQSYPLYIALGTGTGTPGSSDIAGYAEAYATRKRYTSRDLLFAFTSQISVQYLTTDPAGSFTEAMLFDGPTQGATVGTGGVLAGATTLPLGSGAPAVTGGTIAGRYNTIYISDGANSEYASIATTAAAGASSWVLQSGLTYAHAATTPIVAFVGNMFAHVGLTPAAINGGGNALTCQWGCLYQGA